MKTKISFGTDGWRGEIAKDFTFDNVYIVAQAIADYLKTINKENKRVVIGYDTRFLSQEFGKAVGEVLSGNNMNCIFSQGVLSTPGVARIIKNKGLIGGIMITASHNPGTFNGIKFKAHYAGSADETVTKQMEELLFKNEVKKIKFEDAVKENKIEIANLYDEYIAGVK
jgi:phosphomannomutase